MQIALSPRGSISDADYASSISLRADGYYWYLYPYFKELHQKTGKMVDLYGDASFGGHDLSLFQETVARATERVHDQPDRWSVHVGTELEPVQKNVYATVTKSQFLVLLRELIELVERAIQRGAYVVCIGD